jgi:replication fork protection complex subunit Tof1/Swi1
MWIIPSSLSSSALRSTATVIFQHQTDPRLNYATDPNEEAIPPEQLLRRKPTAVAAKRTGGIDWGRDDESDLEGFLAGDDDEELFPAGGPTPRAPNALDELKRARQKRKRNSADEDAELDDGADGELDDSLRRARRKARLLADLAKRRKIKSAEFVRFSDDEEDEEEDARFFAAEEERRKEHARKVHEELEARREASKEKENGKQRKTAAKVVGSDAEDEGEGGEEDGSPRPMRQQSISEDEDGSDADDDTPPSSQSPRSEMRIDKGLTTAENEEDEEDEESEASEQGSPVKEVRMADAPSTSIGDDDEEGEVVARPIGRRARMVLDDSDEE